MAETGTPISGAAPGDSEPQQTAAVARLHGMHYAQLFRLAALLTGDEAMANQVACDSLAALANSARAAEACDCALTFLRRQAIVTSRRAARVGRRSHGEPASGDDRGGGSGRGSEHRGGATGFSDLPVIRALHALPQPEREAIVLRLYLDLSEQQAAAAAGMSLAMLRRHLAAGLRDISDKLPEST